MALPIVLGWLALTLGAPSAPGPLVAPRCQERGGDLEKELRKLAEEAAEKAREREEGEQFGRALEAKEARTFLRDNEPTLKDKDPEVVARALERFGDVHHESFVKPIAKLLGKRAPEVRIVAARTLGTQPYGDAQQTLLRTLVGKQRKFKEKEDELRFQVELVRSLGRIGYGKRGYQMLRDEFNGADKQVRLEILRCFRKHQEKKAFSLYLDNFEEPRPASVNSANNPPASYWRARWEEWNFLAAEVKMGLRALTEETFPTKQEYVNWAKKGPGRKLGFVYKGGS